MNDVTEIPRIRQDEDWSAKGHPAWASVQDDTGKTLKPLIRCMCGQWSGIRLHHVHADGTVTASFFHATKAQHPQGDASAAAGMCGSS